MSCGTLTLGSQPDCDNPLKAGTKPRLFLANYDDVLSATEGATPNLLTALVMASNSVFYLFEGYKQDVKPTQEIINLGSGLNQFKHSLNFLVYEISQTQKNNLQRLARGRFVAIVENKGKDENSFEVYGLGAGLEAVAGVARDAFANGGGYLISLATGDGEFEPLLPQTLFDTDYATSLALVNELAGLPTITTISDLDLAVAGATAETITGTNFYGNGASSAVLSAVWVNQDTFTETAQTGLTVVSDTSITFSSVALSAGAYKLKITTTRGSVTSSEIAIAS